MVLLKTIEDLVKGKTMVRQTEVCANVGGLNGSKD